MQNLSPFAWAVRPFKRYAEFSGRSSRAEFWWFFLGLFLLYIIMWVAFFGAVVGSIGTGQTPPGAGLFGAIGFGAILMGLLWLALIIPTIAVQVRRLHDTNRSGWWLGAFYLLYALYVVLMFGVLRPGISAAVAGEGPPPSSGLSIAVLVLGLVMFVYMIALVVFYCLPGTQGANRYGDDPFGANVREVFA